MQIEDHRLYTFSYDSKQQILDFIWKDSTNEMSDDDFKDALRAFAGQAAAQGATRLLVDVRRFHHAMNDTVGSWRAQEITPLYNGAGIERFAYVVPEQAPATPSDTPDTSSDGEDFATRFFHSDVDARGWLAG